MKNCVIQFRKTVFLLVLVGLLCSPLIVSATSGCKPYSIYDLTYTCTVTSTKGTGTTTGAYKPDYNYASVTVYKAGEPKGSDVAYGAPPSQQQQASLKATATVKGKLGLEKARSIHTATDRNKNFIGDYKETIVAYAFR